MARKWALLVFEDPAAITAIEEGLKDAGYHFTTSPNVLHGEAQARDLKPSVVISRTKFPCESPVLLVDDPIDFERLKYQLAELVYKTARRENIVLPPTDGAPAAPGQPARSRKKWVILVDDDRAILDMVETAIAHPDLSVTTAADAKQAFILARNLRPMLIICDIQMPGGGGLAALQLLRADPATTLIPVVFMTGMELAEAKKLLPLNDPSIGLIMKPLDLDKLRDYVWDFAELKAPNPGGTKPQ